MIEREVYAEVARTVVIDTAQAFHFKAVTDDGRHIEVPFGYQIEEDGFRPFRAGKASPEEIQAQLDQAIQSAEINGVSIGIKGAESVQKLAVQLGLGVDCSNFAIHALTDIHKALNLWPYIETVHRTGNDIRLLHETKRPSWDAKDEEGNSRDLTDDERHKLARADLLDIAWIAKVFGKDPAFILGSVHICNESATERVKPDDMLPGDLIAFRKAGKGLVSHVAVVEQVEARGGEVHADFWHSWHTREFDSGIRRDAVTIEPDMTMRWSHEDLEDPTRYEDYVFLRPLAMATAVAD